MLTRPPRWDPSSHPCRRGSDSCSGCRFESALLFTGGRHHEVVGLAGDKSLEAADDLPLRLALGRAPGNVVLRWPVPTKADKDNAVEGRIRLPVTAPVQPVAELLAR